MYLRTAAASGALLVLGACRNGEVPARTTPPDASGPGSGASLPAPELGTGQSSLPSPGSAPSDAGVDTTPGVPDAAAHDAMASDEGPGGAEPEPVPRIPRTPSLPAEEGSDLCRADSDCVPATCCHPAACVARLQAPNCAGTMCTMDCRGGTLDCGGKCVCRGGRCAALLQP